MRRKEFLRYNLSLFLGSSIASKFLTSFNNMYESRRPSIAERKFISKAIEAIIERYKANSRDEEMSWLFENCFPNTLDSTVDYSLQNGIPDTFIITGDIDAMWLRDSSMQVWPYVKYINEEEHLRSMIEGLIRRQSKCILIDPYANAFYKNPTKSPWISDLTDMKPELHERKFEIDSLCHPIRLAYAYWKISNNIKPFDENWRNACQLIFKTFREQQRKAGRGTYRFQRNTTVATDTQFGNGYGNPLRPIGLIASMFRPSDDATLLPFNIPLNLFAKKSLQQMGEMHQQIFQDDKFANDCFEFAGELEMLIQKYGVKQHPDLGRIYTYEIDGYGNDYTMDDANLPSLLSLPYFDLVERNDPVYKNTYTMCTTEWNPYFFRGKAAKGIGSPHTGQNMIWPLALMMQVMLTENKTEQIDLIYYLKKSSAGTGFMHESFHKDEPKQYTRSWFAMANSLFGEMCLVISGVK